jgi:hypothetical protein
MKGLNRRFRRKLYNNIKVDLKKILYNHVDLNQMAQDMDQWRANENSTKYLGGSIQGRGFLDE